MTEVMTTEEVAALNAARTALAGIARRNHDTNTAGAALIAENAVFSVLNFAHCYQGADLTQEQLHNTRVSA